MSVEPFLKNIYFFIKILNQACSKDVVDWGIDSWKNAFHWATYCEQLYKQVINRPMKTEFELCIKRLNSVNLPLVCGQLNLRFLKKASSHLMQLLMQNPYLPAKLFEETMNICMKDRESVIMQCVDQNWQNASLQMVDRFKSCFDDCTKNRTDGSVNASREILPEIEAKFLWDRLLLTLRASHDCKRLPITVNTVVVGLSKTEVGWNILLHLLHQHEWTNLSDKLSSQIHSAIEDQMCKSIMQSGLPSLIWRSNRAILNEILGQSFPIFSACLTQLIQWGNEFVPVYQHKPDSLYVWTYQPDKKFNDEKSSFESLTSYVVILVESGSHQKKAVLATLRSLEGATLCCIWQDILAKI